MCVYLFDFYPTFPPLVGGAILHMAERDSLPATQMHSAAITFTHLLSPYGEEDYETEERL